MSTSYQEILDFWFPETYEDTLEKHKESLAWRVRGGAHDEIIQKYSIITQNAVDGLYNEWKNTARGRLALITILDQFSRSVWAGTPKAFAQDPRTLELCLEGISCGHFDELKYPWHIAMYQLPLVHCETKNSLENILLAIRIQEKATEIAPEFLKEFYEYLETFGKMNYSTIEAFGRYPHRNKILGRQSTKEELEYLKKGVFTHTTKIK